MVSLFILSILVVVVVVGMAGSALWVMQWGRKLYAMGILKGNR